MKPTSSAGGASTGNGVAANSFLPVSATPTAVASAQSTDDLTIDSKFEFDLDTHQVIPRDYGVS